MTLKIKILRNLFKYQLSFFFFFFFFFYKLSNKDTDCFFFFIDICVLLMKRQFTQIILSYYVCPLVASPSYHNNHVNPEAGQSDWALRIL